MTVSRIGYHNLYTATGVTVAASSEATGYDKENAYDGFMYDWWKPTATGDSWLKATFTTGKNANYFAVWGHDLADHGATVTPQYSTNGGSTWANHTTGITPTTNRVIFGEFTSRTELDHRILVHCSGTIPVIGGVQIGEKLDLPHDMKQGFAPSIIAKVKTKTALSETGAFIGGRKVSEGIKGRISLTNVAPAWMRTYFVPLAEHIQTPKTFVFAWDKTNFSTEVVLAWVTEQIEDPVYSSPLYMDANINFEGVK